MAAEALDASAQVSLVLNPIADTMVSRAHPDANYGADDVLSVAGEVAPKQEFQMLVKFDLGPAKAAFDAAFGIANWRITNLGIGFIGIQPTAEILNPPTPGHFSAIWTPNDNWVEGTGTIAAPTADGLTWNTLPSYMPPSDMYLNNVDSVDGVQVSSAPLPPEGGLKADILAGSLVTLRFLATTLPTAVTVRARSVSPETGPFLGITANQIPEPAADTLAALALATLTAARGSTSRQESRRRFQIAP
jgi:hypothetical protein